MALFILAAALLCFGLWLRFGVKGYRFSSLCCFALAGLLICYGLLRLLPDPVAPTLITALTACVLVGVCVMGVTELFIIRTGLRQPREACDYVVVLGCLVRDDGPSAALQDRIDAACRYLSDHPHAVAILSGGQGDDEPSAEAFCMYNRLIAAGIPASRLIREEKATSTWENLRFSAALLPCQPKQLGIISSDYHLFRVSLLAKRLGLRPTLIPAKTTSIPHAIDHFLREAAGVWHFILLGGRYAQ